MAVPPTLGVDRCMHASTICDYWQEGLKIQKILLLSHNRLRSTSSMTGSRWFTHVSRLEAIGKTGVEHDLKAESKSVQP